MMTEEEKELYDSFREEVEKCYEVANSLCQINPEIYGTWVGSPSERIKAQLKFMNILK